MLETVDEALVGQRSADQLRAPAQQHVGRRRTAHRRDPVAAEDHEITVRLARAAQRGHCHRVQVGWGRHERDRGAERRLPRVVIAALHAHRRGHRRVRRDELEARAVRRELVDGRGVELAREQQVGKRDGQDSAQLLHVGLLVAGRLGQKRGQPAKTIQRGAARRRERRLDRLARGGGHAQQLRDARVVGRLVALAVVEVDEAQQPVVGFDRQADRRLHLVPADERAVDLRRSVAGHERPAGDREPDCRSVVVDAEVVRDLAVARVVGVPAELLGHIRE